MNIVKTYHNQLLKYKNLHEGETCYILGSGPSLNKFKLQDDGIYIGCNHIVKHKDLREKLKYYFFGHGYTIYNNDNSVYGNHKKEVDTLGNHVVKFCMVSRNNDYKIHNFTEESIKELKNINALPCDMNLTDIYTYLEDKPFLNHSIVFPSVQFALYAGFSKIYLVGCDCTSTENINTTNYFFHKSNSHTTSRHLIFYWENIYKFKNENYPNVKLININPIGLEGIMDYDIKS